jgi:hypothetical protein
MFDVLDGLWSCVWRLVSSVWLLCLWSELYAIRYTLPAIYYPLPAYPEFIEGPARRLVLRSVPPLAGLPAFAAASAE